MEDILYLRAIERLVVTSAVPLLIYIGYQLFLKGATGEMNLSVKNDGARAKLTNLSPGALCFLLGIALGAHIMNQSVSVTDPAGRSVNALGNVDSSLSRKVRDVYATMGINVSNLSSRPNVTLKELKEEINQIDSELKIRISHSGLADLEQLEIKAANGDESALKALSKHKEDYIN